ncbi:MAG: type III PLP-dependent enzyme [Actinobacteria bacterium]|nr:type III PLP-dependent enzyme [Actinomycetota bacterium]
MDLGIVEDRYRSLTGGLPGTTVNYALKANSEVEVVELLADLGASFDVASPAEIDLCLKVGVEPDRISYGNTLKKEGDIAGAFERGVTTFAFDSEGELAKLARAAPGASVFCRLLTSGAGADWPLNRKFGCDVAMAIELLTGAATLGLDPCGVSFHVGSQQREPQQWDVAIRDAAIVFGALRDAGSPLRLLNLGGGFPADYLGERPPLAAYTAAIGESLERHFGTDQAETVIEPGRYVVADAGVLHTEVVLVSRKSSHDDHRWVYLDTGVFGGLAETLDEAIKYPIITSRDADRAAGEARGPVVLAGPTCDSIDVLYEHHRYELPLSLAPGDTVTFLSAGAYTKAYCTDGFNGFFPLPAYCLPPNDIPSNGARTRNDENRHTSSGSGSATP